MNSQKVQPLDPQGKVVMDSDWGITTKKTMTFNGAVENDPGDESGTGNPATLFTVTGTVLLRLLAICTTTLTGASATVEVGTVLITTGLIPLTTGTDIEVNEIWHDNAPDKSVELSSVLAENIVSADVIQTVRTDDVDTGVIDYYAIWYPLSNGSSVEAA